MRPDQCSAVLLPDREWHSVRPGSLSEMGDRVTFVDVEHGEVYQLPADSVLAARGLNVPPPELRRLGDVGAS